MYRVPLLVSLLLVLSLVSVAVAQTFEYVVVQLLFVEGEISVLFATADVDTGFAYNVTVPSFVSPVHTLYGI